MAAKSKKTIVTSPDTFKVGDTVNFTGGGVYTSSIAPETPTQYEVCVCEVTIHLPDAARPYHIVGGDVWGWVESGSVQALTEGDANP